MAENAHMNAPMQNAASSGVLIFGGGACAKKIASNLADHNINAWVVSGENGSTASVAEDTVKRLPGSQLIDCRLIDCKGFAGNFQLRIQRGDELLHKRVGAIVVAEDPIKLSNIEAYGLKPDGRILDISLLEDKMRNGSIDDLFMRSARIAFFCGWKIDSHPVVAQRMLKRCLQLQQSSKYATFFFTGNLKVAYSGAEAVYQQAKRSGSVFLKFTKDFPTVRTSEQGRFDIDYYDELTRTPFRLTADWIVVDETMGPGAGLDTLVQGLEIETDTLGFAQSDNVHRLSNATNRRGIFVAGGARGILCDHEQSADADQVTVKVMAFLHGADGQDLPKVEIHRGRCAKCLTCHRLCPHKAIDIGADISVVTEACQSCGICLAGCPARAIDMQGLKLGADTNAWGKMTAAQADRSDRMPKLMIFGCSRSAGQACKLTRLMGYSMPPGVHFVEVPCGGTISTRNLMAAFEDGIDAVMLCTCHTDNCRSDKGNLLARKRAQCAADLLQCAGIESERLYVASVAANMGNEFYVMVNQWRDRIKALHKIEE
ncbi:MAG: hydrogenase iron-sulfur subunit [Desulfobacteraceae bacterium]|jgi:coenzyme F420-reducing hydrogenase delta subunit/Pyruvate/2-oxoacid:ferredoxin oxidoreductase delta subunit